MLIGDELVEHVPGCNMAFRKQALQAIGSTRSTALRGMTSTSAGSSWARGERIAFSSRRIRLAPPPCHRASLLCQQRGYGFAEGHLKRTYPGRFNVFGHLVWPGRVYDGVHSGLRLLGLPALLPSRVYQGRPGGAPFQSLHQLFATCGSRCS